MHRYAYRFGFDAEVALEEVEAAMLLALFGTESLHGAVVTRLEPSHYLDRESRQLVLDYSTEVGRDLSRLFVGFLMREHGPDCFTVERVPTAPSTSQESNPLTHKRS